MSGNVTLTAWHGWAFDQTCWNPWKPVLPNEISIDFYDRGYWGNSKSADVNHGDGLHIVLTHSFGLHLCPPSQITKADMLVIFCGFKEFHPVAAQFKRRSRLILNQMIQQLREQPEEVLREFLKNTYKPGEAPEMSLSGFDGEKLLHDLQTLNQSSLDMEPFKNVSKLCILHGSSDSIVPKAKGRELYNILQDRASYFEIKGAGHALPFTHTEQCWAFIKPVLDELIQMSK